MMASSKRILKEFREIQANERETDIELAPNKDNIYLWNAKLRGPADTPFEGGVFWVVLRLPDTYPMSPPTATFSTKIFHPNVHFKTGEVCLDILKTTWSPAWSIQSVCRAISALMSHPEASSPLNCDAGNLLRSGDDLGYASMARMYTVEYAQG